MKTKKSEEGADVKEKKNENIYVEIFRKSGFFS
jgi:hypothetical protein